LAYFYFAMAYIGNYTNTNETLSMQILDINEVGVIIRKARTTISSEMVRHPERLPKWFKLPGSKKPLWYAATVEAFIQKSAEACGALPENLENLK